MSRTLRSVILVTGPTEPRSLNQASGARHVAGEKPEEKRVSMAARMTDKVLQSGPHCHAPMHPPAPTPTPLPHPPMPLTIIKGQPNVLIGGQMAARVMDMTQPCMIPGCVPGGPGLISKGSATVMIGNMPAARVGDMTSHAACVGPIPGPTGNILPPGCPTVMIGG